MEGTPTGEESPIELTERELEMREMEMKRLFEDRAAMMEATDRFVYRIDTAKTFVKKWKAMCTFYLKTTASLHFYLKA